MTQISLSTPKSEAQYAGSVVASWELRRSLGLPRRILDLDTIPDVSPIYCRPETHLRYWPIQSAAIIEAADSEGLFAIIGVGHGKTLIGLTLPDAMQSERAVYLVKPDLKKQLEREIASFYDKHFILPLDRIRIVAYTELSSAGKAEILDQIKPDLIIADEAHCLKNPKSARTKRFLRYMEANPSCRIAALSGTMTTRSLFDYAHIIELALRKNSPLPKSYHDLKAWAGALDVNPPEPYQPGALMQFCVDGETHYDGFRRRLVETPGVVATQKESIGTSLIIRPVQIRVPAHVTEMAGKVRRDWCLEDQDNDFYEEYSDASELWAVERQIQCGFYYVWQWPDGEPNVEWLQVRADWNREVREKLKRSTTGMDSPLLLANAAERYLKWVDAGGEGTVPEKAWNSLHWPAWRVWKDVPPPPVAPVWVDDFLVRATLTWAAEQDEPAIIWYEHKAVGEKLAEHLPHYGAGADAGIATEQVIVCSIRAQGTGKNLQRYSRNLFTSMPPSGSTFEQTVGRTHRSGQLADEVIVEYFEHTGEASMERIIEDATYVERTTGDRQKALYATFLSPRGMRY